jgi:hypothetical protein
VAVDVSRVPLPGRGWGFFLRTKPTPTLAPLRLSKRWAELRNPPRKGEGNPTAGSQALYQRSASQLAIWLSAAFQLMVISLVDQLSM